MTSVYYKHTSKVSYEINPTAVRASKTIFLSPMKLDRSNEICRVHCVFVTFPCGILGQVWYLIVSIPDLAAFLTLRRKDAGIEFK